MKRIEDVISRGAELMGACCDGIVVSVVGVVVQCRQHPIHDYIEYSGSSIVIDRGI